MKLKRSLSLILAGMMLLTSLNICVFADTESDTSTEVEYSGPQSIYYLDFEGATVGKTGVDYNGVSATDAHGTNYTATVKQDEGDTNKYLNVAMLAKSNARLNFEKKTTEAHVGADKYVIEYKIRPHLGTAGVIKPRAGGGAYGVLTAALFQGNIREYTTEIDNPIGSYTDDEWYTFTIVYDANYVDSTGAPWVEGTKYYVRDVYLNGEKLNDEGIKHEVKSSETNFLTKSATMKHMFWLYNSASASYDLDYMRYYASTNEFAAKLPQATGNAADSLDVWFNNIPVKDDLLSNISVVDQTGAEVAGISGVTYNNNFDPGMDYAQSVKLIFDTELEPGASYKLKFDNVTDIVGNTLSTELDFSTRSLKIYADSFKLMSGESEQPTLVDGTYSVECSFVNDKSEPITPVIAAALYNAEGVLSSLKFEEIEVPANSDGAKFTMTDLVLSGTSGGKLKLFALKSATDWSPLSAVQVIDASGSAAEGEFNAELAAYNTAFETESSVDGDTLAITTKVKAWDSAMAGRQATIVAFKEGKSITDVSLSAPLETVIGIESAALTEDGVTYKIPDVKGNYPTKLYISNAVVSADGIVEYFGKEYIDAGLEIVKDIVASEVDGFLTDYEKALSIDISEYSALTPEAKEVYAKSIEALRNEKDTKEYAGINEFCTAMGEALIFANIKDGADIKTVIDTKLKDETEYTLWTDTLSDDAYSTVLNKVNTAGVLTYKQLSDTFEKAVVLCGIERADNYSQVLTILKEMYEEIDIEDISEYSNSIQKTVATNIAGKSYDDYEALGAAFEVFLNAAKKGGSSGGSSGGGSGGGGSSKPGSTGNYGSVTMGSVAPAEKAEENKPADPSKFNDLSGFDWARDAIYALAEKGIINGKTENNYAPADLITRAELTKLVVAFYGLKSGEVECNFADVDKSDWYYTYINAGVNNGIINGTGEGLFSPDMNVTREMAAAIIYRAAQKSGKVFEKNKNEFGDKAEIEEYALDAVGYLSGAGILNGDETGNVKPKAALTRAEAAVLLNNLLK